MTDLTRSSTLSLRRPAAALTSRAKEPAATRPAQPPKAEVGTAQASTEAVLRSETLLQGRSYVGIVHNGETYQLRATRLGKLILTK
jgi:hemin uptake protein HemP